MTRFRDSVEFGPTLDAAAERLDISATAVEKDYWVSEVLRVLKSHFATDFIFKGGTSLSKGYGIVERFSEDIDLLILPGDQGRGATDKLMKAMGDTAAAKIGGEASPVGGAETGRHRSYEVRYPATREPTALIGTSVLLEMGVRGGQHPHESVTITSLLSDALDAVGTDLTAFDDIAPFELDVLHPARTLLEKLVHIHRLSVRLSTEEALLPDRRSGRHFYDVYQLLGDERMLELLTDRTQVHEILASIEDVTRMHFGGGNDLEERPADGFAATPAFDPSSSVATRLRSVYEVTMPELYFGSGALPTWDEVCSRVAAHRELL